MWPTLRKELKTCQVAEAERLARAEDKHAQSEEAMRQVMLVPCMMRDVNEAKFGKQTQPCQDQFIVLPDVDTL